MSKIKLDDRLSAVASFVRKGSVVADIGTDHGYVVAYLISEGICPKGIASDLRKGPLENARQTVADAKIADKVELILSDGLQNIKENSCDDIVIAGMGGNLITDILNACPWIKSKDLNIIAQPMSHAEVLREYFIANGFEILKEKVVTDGKRLYCIINAAYTGVSKNYSKGYSYVGEIVKNKDELSSAYINKVILTLEKKLSALISADKGDNENLGELIKDIKSIISEENNGNG